MVCAYKLTWAQWFQVYVMRLRMYIACFNRGSTKTTSQASVKLNAMFRMKKKKSMFVPNAYHTYI